MCPYRTFIGEGREVPKELAGLAYPLALLDWLILQPFFSIY